VTAPGSDLDLDTPGPAGDGGGEAPRLSTVLYVEDNLSNVKLMERLIALRTGIRLIPAMQGSIGLELAREHHPDLILLDLNLPDASGAEVLARLRGDAATADIPVVVLSADATRGQVERLLSAGARAYLTKPFDLEEFLQLLDEAVGPRPQD
jgi:CheY-like chemotaxis protein